MTNRVASISLVLASCIGFAVTPAHAIRVGQAAPNFTATDSNGQTRKLSDFTGKFVVLEWTNRACGFTRPHYTSGWMQNEQRTWTEKGVIWLTVTSSGFGEDGYVSAEDESAYLKEMKAVPTAVLMDHDGTLGHLYNAKTTPEIFIINPQGVLIYEGASDGAGMVISQDKNGESLKTARDYISQTLTEAMAGKPVSMKTTISYGCEIHYAGVLARELADEAKRNASE